jgi:hypothetical protein
VVFVAEPQNKSFSFVIIGCVGHVKRPNTIYILGQMVVDVGINPTKLKTP